MQNLTLHSLLFVIIQFTDNVLWPLGSSPIERSNRHNKSMLNVCIVKGRKTVKERERVKVCSFKKGGKERSQWKDAIDQKLIVMKEWVMFMLWGRTLQIWKTVSRNVLRTKRLVGTGKSKIPQRLKGSR